MRRLAIFTTVCLLSPCFADIFVEERGNQDQCESLCLKEYPLHTYPKPEHLKACERGCRLFSLVKISKTDDQGKPVAGKSEDFKGGCESVCKEAYPAKGKSENGEKGLDYHCEVGCKYGEQVHDGKKSAIQDELRFRDPILSDLMSRWFRRDSLGNSNENEDGSEDGFLNVRPFQMMHQMMNDMMNQMNQAMSSFSWSVVTTDENGSTKISSGGSDQQQDSPSKLLQGLASSQQRISPGVIVIKTSHSGILPSLDGDELQEMEPFEDIRGSNTKYMDKNNDPFRRIRNGGPGSTEKVEDRDPRTGDWLECVSRKAGIPRWLLLTSIFLCSLMFVWLCFAATGPAGHDHGRHQQRVYAISAAPPAYSCKQPWSEIPYICPAYEKTVIGDKLSPLSDSENEDADKSDKQLLIESDKDEAGPLPAKIHFEKA